MAGAAEQAAVMEGAFKAMKADIAEAIRLDSERRASAAKRLFPEGLPVDD
jgi:hypothetical protein